jgi:hypothetical protein
MFLVIDIGQPLAKLGYLGPKKGQGQSHPLEDHMSVGKVEKGCGDIRVGIISFLLKKRLMSIGTR